MENSMKFETIRHGEKQGNELSERGVEHSREKAEEIFREIESAPPGTVFYIIPSNVGRAVETRNTIEARLRELSAGSENIEFVSVQDAEGIKEAQNNTGKKYIMTEFQPSSALGFNERTPSIPAFLKFKKLLGNNEDLIGKAWAAKPGELEQFRKQVKNEIPDLDVNQINPEEFGETPEEAALKYIRLMKRMTEITEKYFSGRPWKSLHIGHNLSSDFAAMALLGKEISIQSIDELGGRFRDFLESAKYELKDGRIQVSYRGQELVIEKYLGEVINELEEASEKRKIDWKKPGKQVG